ncbi:MAG: putative glycoside hydrolase [Patescibacteria group bacterium]
MVKKILTYIFFGLVLAGLFLFLKENNVIYISAELRENIPILDNKILDFSPQKPLANPPETIKAIYLTNWSANNEDRLSKTIQLIKDTELNALIIDIKDFSGYLGYNTELELPKKYNAIELRIPQLNRLIKRLHDEGIYLIGRISVFQDQRLALAKPELAVHSKQALEKNYGVKPVSENSILGENQSWDFSKVSTTWKDYKGLTWMDTASQEVWDYNIAIAKEILDRGFDEVNFDYVRFPSDGNIDDTTHPFWDEKKLKTYVVRDFFKYLRDQLPLAKLSADLFGLVTVNRDGLGIGQHLEYALPYFDAIAPMTYPSHYFKGFIGYENPSEHPYEVIKYSLDSAAQRMKQYKLSLYNALGTTTPISEFNFPIAKLRPFLQDFDLGADYDGLMIRKEIQAVYDVASTAPEFFDGWMLWNASNNYTREALLGE